MTQGYFRLKMAAAGSSNWKRWCGKGNMYEQLPTFSTDFENCAEDDSDLSDEESWGQVSCSESSEDEGNTKDCRCTCGICSLYNGNETRWRCCMSYEVINERLECTELKCITQHPGFRDNCLSLYVLEVSLLEKCKADGPLTKEEEIHEVYREMSAKRFQRWVFKKFGESSSPKYIPRCVLSKILLSFPEEGKACFKYPRV